MYDDTTTWKTKDGRVLRITEMTDNHIRNTIRWMRRNTLPRFVLIDMALRALSYAAGAPDGAAMCAEMEASAAFERAYDPKRTPPEHAITEAFPSYPTMLKEYAKRRAANPQLESI